MIGIDANILLYAYCKQAPEHGKARAFLIELNSQKDVAISEFTLTELYLLLRNPAVLPSPLSPSKAARVIESYRQHPVWRIPGFPPKSRELHDRLWEFAGRPQFPRRQLYDIRTALALQAFGVREFATANLKDFKNLGFTRVWNPVA